MISGILNAFANALPKIGEAALKLITVLCNTLTEALPKLVTTGVNLLLAILKGISENIGKDNRYFSRNYNWICKYLISKCGKKLYKQVSI